MDIFDATKAKQAPRSRRGFNSIWNLLTIIVLIVTLCLAAYIALLVVDPQSELNPFPPGPLSAVEPTIRPTSTLRIVLQPSWTPTPIEVLPTKTPRPTNTPFMTDTPFGMASPTMVLTNTPGSYSFALQQGSPVALENVFYPDLGCDWMGVGGQVLDIGGEGVLNLTLRLMGTLDGQMVDLTTLSGSNKAYHDAGFEFKLADKPIASQGSLYIQLFDQAGLPMSDKIYFDTYDDCSRNLIILYIVQVK